MFAKRFQFSLRHTLKIKEPHSPVSLGDRQEVPFQHIYVNACPPSARKIKEKQLSWTTSGSIRMPALPAWSRRATTYLRDNRLHMENCYTMRTPPNANFEPRLSYADRLVFVARNRLTTVNVGVVIMIAQQSSKIHKDRKITIAHFSFDGWNIPCSITRGSLEDIRFRILFAQCYLRRRLCVSFSPEPRFLLVQSTNLNIETDRARHPAPQPSLHFASTNSLARFFCGGHWTWSNETSASLLASVDRPAQHLVPSQSHPGRSGRCYAGTREHPRSGASLEHFFFGE